jgi:preprotein translocase subunit SecA
VALEDDLMRLFGGERVKNIMDTLVGDENVPLEMGMLTRQIENAQKRIEGNNFNLRKHVLEYDDVMNKQREIIYRQRRQVLMGDDITGFIQEMIDAIVGESVDAYCPDDKFPEEWDLKDLNARFERIFLVESEKLKREEKEGLDREELRADLQELVAKAYAAKEEEMQKAGFSMRDIERMVLLRVVDEKWMDHIDAMDQFRRGISLRALGQRDPVVEYKMEGFDMFDEMVGNIREDAVNMLFHIKVQSKVEQKERQEIKTNSAEDGPPRPAHKDKTAGRNAPCPCGSGKKYKNCCGKS